MVGGLFGFTPCGVWQRLVRNEFLEKSFYRRNKDAVDHRLLPSPVQENGATFGIVVAECLESCKVFGFDLCGVFHFNQGNIGKKEEKLPEIGQQLELF